MIAVANIEAKGKTFHPGETVTGLSKADEKWMKDRGYLADMPKEAKNAKDAAEKG